MFFGLTANQKQSRSALRDALAEIDRAKPEDRRRVADALAVLARNSGNPTLTDEILISTKHLRPVAVDQHTLESLMLLRSDLVISRELERLAMKCLNAEDAAGLALVADAQRSHGARLEAAARVRREFETARKVKAEAAQSAAAIERQRESRRLTKRAEARLAFPGLGRLNY